MKIARRNAKVSTPTAASISSPNCQSPPSHATATAVGDRRRLRQTVSARPQTGVVSHPRRGAFQTALLKYAAVSKTALLKYGGFQNRPLTRQDGGLESAAP